MTGSSDLSALINEVAELRRQVRDQAAQLAELRGDDEAAPQARFGRRHLIGALAGLGAAGLAGVASADPAAAADGDPLLLGTDTNASSSETRLAHTGANDSLDVGVAVSTTGWTAVGISCDENPDFEITLGRNALHADVSTLTTSGDRAIWARAKDGFGVFADCFSPTFPAVAASNFAGGPGLGGFSEDGGPQLWLDAYPEDPAGPPASGLRGRGQIKADVNGDLWMCVATGTPGTWTRLLREDTAHGRIVPIAPFRALDTRAANGRPSGSPVIPGQLHGPLRGGQNVTLDLAGITPIPTTATGVTGNLTVVAATAAGHLRVFPAGSTSSTSAINFTKNTTVANAFTSGINPTGLRLVAPISSTITYHLIVDVTAYIT